jgi:hypothetical protein
MYTVFVECKELVSVCYPGSNYWVKKGKVVEVSSLMDLNYIEYEGCEIIITNIKILEKNGQPWLSKQ